mgnify:CR=1 FL=1
MTMKLFMVCPQIRYAEHLPAVLKGITCTFPGKKKVGVVGRTGSGKSTLIQAIFRIVEPSEGSIIIDDVDITKIGLHDLRSRLSIIPQDPTMFEGTVRGNLDPLDQYSDYEIWEVKFSTIAKAVDTCFNMHLHWSRTSLSSFRIQNFKQKKKKIYHHPGAAPWMKCE